MNNRKKILFVDDHASVRASFEKQLTWRGFDISGAADVAGTQRLIQQMGNKIDVMVLDMVLNDPQFPDIYGADLGLEARETIGKQSPEFLILSSYNPSEYYDAPLKLDAAVYLIKDQVSPDDVIRHIRALCLRRALSSERPEIAHKIVEIAESSLTHTEAVSNFCRELLPTEMQVCLGVPFVFLLTDETGTQNCGSDADLPSGHDERMQKSRR